MDDERDRHPEFRRLVADCRDRCLWFLREDYCPTDPAEMRLVLGHIERHGDREAFVAARELSRWLSRDSSEPSVGC